MIIDTYIKERHTCIMVHQILYITATGSKTAIHLSSNQTLVVDESYATIREKIQIATHQE